MVRKNNTVMGAKIKEVSGTVSANIKVRKKLKPKNTAGIGLSNRVVYRYSLPRKE